MGEEGKPGIGVSESRCVVAGLGSCGASELMVMVMVMGAGTRSIQIMRYSRY